MMNITIARIFLYVSADRATGYSSLYGSVFYLTLIFIAFTNSIRRFFGIFTPSDHGLPTDCEFVQIVRLCSQRLSTVCSNQ